MNFTHIYVGSKSIVIRQKIDFKIGWKYFRLLTDSIKWGYKVSLSPNQYKRENELRSVKNVRL